MDISKLLQSLNQMGFKEYTSPFDSDKEITPLHFQLRVDTLYPDYPLCTSNDKLFINVDVTNGVFHGHKMESVKFELCHANANDDWMNLEFYGLNPSQFRQPSDIQPYIDKLLKMWQAGF